MSTAVTLPPVTASARDKTRIDAMTRMKREGDGWYDAYRHLVRAGLIGEGRGGQDYVHWFWFGKAATGQFEAAPSRHAIREAARAKDIKP